MYRRLAREPYCLRKEELARLTDRQIWELYLAPLPEDDPEKWPTYAEPETEDDVRAWCNEMVERMPGINSAGFADRAVARWKAEQELKEKTE